jgi:hypothetical protein
VNDLYKENYKLLKKESEEDYRRWKDLPCSLIGRINIVKMAILPRAICMFNAVPMKIPMAYITEIEKSNLQFIWKHKRLQIAKTIMSKKSHAGGITISDVKEYYRDIAINTVWYCHKNRYEDQWSRIEESDMDLPGYTHLIFDKVPKIYDREKTASSTNFPGKLAICLQKMKLDPCLSPCTITNSNWIKDLNVRHETLWQVWERARNTLEAIDIAMSSSVELIWLSN